MPWSLGNHWRNLKPSVITFPSCFWRSNIISSGVKRKIGQHALFVRYHRNHFVKEILKRFPRSGSFWIAYYRNTKWKLLTYPKAKYFLHRERTHRHFVRENFTFSTLSAFLNTYPTFWTNKLISTQGKHWRRFQQHLVEYYELGRNNNIQDYCLI